MAQHIVIVGASRGIGLEMARQAKARGDRVTATVRSDASAKALDGIADEVLICAVADEASLAKAAGASDTAIDLLVCNAGVYRGRGALDAPDSGADAWEEVLMTNVAGPFLCARAFLPRIEAAKGKIAIISSKMGSNARAPGGAYLYRASKAAATNVASNLASELRDRGVAVGSYHPGWVRTDMGGSAADISAEESASGLLSRFEALSVSTTGVFEDYAGEAIPF
ncbi:MAG: SDR family oxidoreductase [Pseudomonadota bacterium]